MAKQRNLSDAEIGIVKAMLRKGWRNDVIHFYFNKPDRLISSGRITQIKKGKYGASVEEALPEELEAFLSAWQDPEAKAPPAPSPVDLRILRSMFVREAGTWRLAGGETDRTECKAGFRLHAGNFRRSAGSDLVGQGKDWRTTRRVPSAAIASPEAKWIRQRAQGDRGRRGLEAAAGDPLGRTGSGTRTPVHLEIRSEGLRRCRTAAAAAGGLACPPVSAARPWEPSLTGFNHYPDCTCGWSVNYCRMSRSERRHFESDMRRRDAMRELKLASARTGLNVPTLNEYLRLAAEEFLQRIADDIEARLRAKIGLRL